MTRWNDADSQRLLQGQRDAVVLIADAVAEAAQRGGRVIAVRGRQGVGKTRVLHGLQEQFGSAAVVAEAEEWTRDLPGALIERLAEQWGDLAQDSGADVQLDPAARKAAADALLRRWRHLDEGAVKLVLIDDAHLADAHSLQMLTYLGRRISSTPLVLVLAVESESLLQGDPDFHRLIRTPDVLRLDLGALSSQETLELSRQMGVWDMDPHGAAVLHRHCRGHLHWCVEVLEDLPQRRMPTDPAQLPLPRTAVREVMEPLDRAEAPLLRRLTHALATLDDQHDLVKLAHIAEIAEIQDLADVVDLGVFLGVIQEVDDAGRRFLRLRHPLAREVIARDVLPSQRRGFHRRAAEVEESPDQRLLHQAAATEGSDPRLAEGLGDAAERAGRAGRWRAAARFRMAASSLLPASADRDRHLLRGVDAFASAGRVVEAVPWLPAVAAVPPSSERDTVLANVAMHQGKAAEADDLLSRAAAAVGEDTLIDAQVASRRTLDSLVRWDGEGVCSWASRAMELSPQDAPTAVESQAMRALGVAAQGRLRDAEAEIRTVQLDPGDGAQNQRFRLCAGWVSVLAGSLRSAVRELEAAIPTQHRGGSLRISLWAQGWLARVQFLLGEWDDALRTSEEGLRRSHDAGIVLVSPLLHWTSAEIRLWRGHSQQDAMRHEVGVAHLSGYLAMQAPTRFVRGVAAQVRGDSDGRVAALMPLLDTDPWTARRTSIWPWQSDLIDALIAVNRTEDAVRLSKSFTRHTRTAGAHVKALAAGAAGRVAGAQGDSDRSDELFCEAAGHLQSRPRPTAQAALLLNHGQMLRRAGRRRDALEKLMRAQEFYEGVGAEVLVDRCEQELRATGMMRHPGRRGDGAPARVDTESRDPLTSLTPQEKAVSELVVLGLTNGEVAQRLFIAEKTVQYHLTRIYSKLDIRSRTELTSLHRTRA